MTCLDLGQTLASSKATSVLWMYFKGIIFCGRVPITFYRHTKSGFMFYQNHNNSFAIYRDKKFDTRFHDDYTSLICISNTCHGEGWGGVAHITFTILRSMATIDCASSGRNVNKMSKRVFINKCEWSYKITRCLQFFFYLLMKNIKISIYRHFLQWTRIVVFFLYVLELKLKIKNYKVFDYLVFELLKLIDWQTLNLPLTP